MTKASLRGLKGNKHHHRLLKAYFHLLFSLMSNKNVLIKAKPSTQKPDMSDFASLELSQTQEVPGQVM